MAPGTNPKHTIYALSINIVEIETVIVDAMRKGPRLANFLKTFTIASSEIILDILLQMK